MPKPIVAIVGRPNVGKSTLFNKLAGSRISIVEDTPGVTRDRIYADAEWLAHRFTIIDTGGLEPETDDHMLKEMLRQAEIAIETADVIIFVVDAKTGVTDTDSQVADMLRRASKPVVLTVNKIDDMTKGALEAYEFYALGLSGDPIPVSAGQMLGLGDLLDQVVTYFPTADFSEYEDEVIKVAIIGKPNVGKSSLINKILGEERVIVSDEPGTTRDAIDTYLEKDGSRYILIDTAGIRRKSKIKADIERYSIVRAVSAVERADVCVLLISAEEGITEQDTKIAGIAHERGKAAVVAVNKWDAIEKDDKTMKKYLVNLETELSYMPYAPKVFISAKTGQRIERLFDLIQSASQNSALRVRTGVLNEVLIEATAISQPPADKGRQLKIYYATQASVKPPTFILFVNDPELMHFSYKRYLENQLRQAFGFQGTPIRFILRKKTDYTHER
ncbi:MAG: ribosome biogenesis GTPase Der [Syntrophomonadaceae bacterium]|jgi:GTP-binding protein|nr:ribosome biogenesis GTPase Der [Syntrophomonadaceae bacterium]